MKTKTLILALFSLNLTVFSQQVNERAYKELHNYIKLELDSYYCKGKEKKLKAVQEKVLSDNLFEIYKSVLPNSGNANLNAFTYALNKEKQTLGLSFSKNLNQNKRTFFTTKINLEGDNFPIFTNNEWSKKLGIKLGLDIVIGKPSQYFSSKKCETLKTKRQIFADSLKLNYYLTLKGGSEKKKLLEGLQEKLNKFFKTKLEKDQLDKIEVTQDSVIWRKWDSLKLLKKQLSQYDELSKISKNTDAKKEIKTKLYEFDKKNDILNGYNVYWISLNAGYGNQEVSLKGLEEDSKPLEEDYSEYTIEGYLRGNKLNNKQLQYFSVGLSLIKSGMLNLPTLKHSGTPYLMENNGIYQVITGDNNLFINNFEDVSNTFWSYNLNVYYANFFLLDKTLGLSFDFNLNDKMTNQKFTENYQKNYSTNIGLLFRNINEKKISNATFGISAGFENAPTNQSSKDFFTVKAFVGIPFSVFNKKKE